MLVRCESNLVSKLTTPRGISSSLSAWFNSLEDEVFLTVNRTYVVYGIMFKAGFPWYFIADEVYNEYPAAYPAMLFSIAENRLSSHWVFGLNPRNGEPLIACQKWVTDALFLEKLINSEAIAVKFFKEYKALLDVEFPNPLMDSATVLEGNWLQCFKCNHVWESKSNKGMVLCPGCNNLFNNPSYVTQCCPS